LQLEFTRENNSEYDSESEDNYSSDSDEENNSESQEEEDDDDAMSKLTGNTEVFMEITDFTDNTEVFMEITDFTDNTEVFMAITDLTDEQENLVKQVIFKKALTKKESALESVISKLKFMPEIDQALLLSLTSSDTKSLFHHNPDQLEAWHLDYLANRLDLTIRFIDHNLIREIGNGAIQVDVPYVLSSARTNNTDIINSLDFTPENFILNHPENTPLLTINLGEHFSLYQNAE
jgi:hypothetical protein